jgi:hypothetical protein
MAGTRRRRIAATRTGISAEAAYAWQRGDKHACNQALDVQPFDFDPFTVTDPEPPDHVKARDGTDAVAGSSNWARAWELRCALIELAGEPGPSDLHGRPLGVVLPPSERWRR